MKKSFLILAASLLAITTINAQSWNKERVKGNGEMVTKNRSTGSYEGVQLVGSMDVVLVAGSEGNLQVEAESNLQEYIVTEVKNGTLKISTKENVNLRPTKDIKITVPIESIDHVSLTGSGDIWSTDVIKGKEFKVSVTGSGDMKLNLDVQDLEGKITGSGDISLEGKAKDFDCKITGSGDFKAYELKAENVEARVSGSGDVQVYASKSLDATVAGSGDITYKGNPEKQDFKTSGSGSVSSY